MREKATVCRICGAPRYEKATTILCYDHWTEYCRAIYDRNHPNARRAPDTPSLSQNRIQKLRAAYDRLNIRARLDALPMFTPDALEGR